MMAELSLLVKATVVLALALMGTRLLRRARASVRALLLASAFGVLLVLPAASLVIPERAVEIPMSSVDTFTLVLEQVAQSAPAIPATGARTERVTPPWRLPSIAAMLRAAWALVAVALLLHLALPLWHLRGIRRTGVPWLEGAGVVNDLVARAGVRRHVEVFIHEDLSAPMTFGSRRPAIGLPPDAPRWDHAALHHALVHELEHVRRGDWTIHLTARLACALYWFHPLAWVAARQLCLEAERACDDAVLREAERTAYAEQLVALARRLSRRSPVAVLSMAARSDLSTRIRAVLDARQARGPAGTFWTVGVLSISIGFALTISPLQAAPRKGAPYAAGETQQLAAGAPARPPNPLPGLAAMVDSPTTGPNAPRFEVASVKRNAGPSISRGGRGGGTTLPTGQIRTTNAPLTQLIRMAYGLRMTDRIVGGPDWIDSDGFDVDARPEMPVTVERARLMLRTLLAERFNVVVRREPRDMPIFALTLARSDGRLGPQIQRPAGECVMVVPFAAAADRGSRTPPISAPAGPQPPPGAPDRRCGMGPDGPNTIKAGSTAMSGLITLLTPFVDRPIVDRTGLTGVFDFDLHYAGASIGTGRGSGAGPSVDATDPGAPSVFTALQEQLGLALEPSRGPVDVLVVIRAEPPTPNDAPELDTPLPPQATATPQDALAFEVASIRRNAGRDIVVRIDTLPGGRFIATNVSTRALIRLAYQAGDYQIVGGPGWLATDRFDIEAKADRALPPMGGPLQGPSEVRLMLQTLLRERFGLAVHTETRQLPAYSLVMARADKRLGPRLTMSPIDCAALTAELAPKGDRPACGIRAGPGTIVLEGVPVRQLADVLSGLLNLPVTDDTRLPGNMDLQLSWAMLEPGAAARVGEPLSQSLDRPPLFTALEEQAGLRLERTTGPVDVFVIDRVERPTEN